MRWHGFREHLGDETLLVTSNADGRSPSPSRSSSTPRPSIGALLLKRWSTSPLPRSGGFTRGVLAEVLAEVRATTSDDLERAVRSLTIELADLKATLAEVRLAFATDRTQALELPNPLPKRADLN
jgi:hypothetical protein